MAVLPLYHTWQRYRTLQTHRISALPIVILMPHSACNCRCVMCDIWKDNQNLKQLTEEDVAALLPALKKLGTKQVVMSGGEALLHNNFFRLCEILKKQGIKVTLLSTGLLLKKHAEKIIEYVNDVIVSLDGDEQMHDSIRNINGAYNKLSEGVQYLKTLKPGYKVTGRTVIHRLNFRDWPNIIDSAKKMGLQQISFLPADVSSHAFNREVLWSTSRQHELLVSPAELPEMMSVIDSVIKDYEEDFESGFIAESVEKIKNIHTYYAASHGLAIFPFKKCNAPWVSTVVEADGTVRPCFFHEAIGNINTASLDEILNDKKVVDFRRQLDTAKNEMCKKCVCYLNLSVRVRV